MFMEAINTHLPLRKHFAARRVEKWVLSAYFIYTEL